MRALRWHDLHGTHEALVAAEHRLTDALVRALPNASTDNADASAEHETILASRDRLGPVPDHALHHARLVILLDPTTPDRLRATRALAGRRASRLLLVPALDTEVAAEHTFLLLLATVRRLLPAYSDLVAGARAPGVTSRLTDQETAAPNWVGMPQPGWLWGKTLGILGLGRVGEAVAARAVAFGMHVIYHDHVDREDAALRSGLERRRFDQVLREADAVTLHLPLTTDTIRIIDAPELALMKPSAVLINTAHGRLVDEGSLIRALRLDAIGGAGLDVFAYEPVGADSPLLGLDNVVLTPHVAGVDEATARDYLASLVVTVLEGLAPRER